jgi:hypothetical protein
VKRLVYTCVFGGYDRILPPVRREDGIEYVAVTDLPALAVPGWTSMVVDPTSVGTPRVANRYFKILAHEVFPGYDASIYLDGNIRVLGRMRDFFARIEGRGAALGLYRHPLRKTVREEVEQCVRRRQVTDAAAAYSELQDYRDQGFPDEAGCLIEASILLRDHRHQQLKGAMDEWWRLFRTYQSRDQFSLPFVLWRTGVPAVVFEDSFRDPNPCFGWYPHAGAGTANPHYAMLMAKSHGSIAHRVALSLWHLKWKIQRLTRRPN